MKSSPKYLYRRIAAVILFVAICITLPQLSRMSESGHRKSVASKPSQEPQAVGDEKAGLPQGKLGESETTSMITIPASQVPKQRIAAPNAVAAATKQGEVEPNGTTATASPISGSSAKIIGNLFPNGDIDFYSFTATAGDRFYAATMTSFSAGNSTDSQITLLASDGTTVIEFDDDNGSFAALSSSISGAIIPTTGTYFLKVNDFTAGTTSMRPYELWFQLQSGAPTPEVESNDTPATANPLPVSGWVSGTRNPAAATEQDWYSLSLNAGDTVFLSLDVDPEDDGVLWNGRLGFALFGDASNQILVVDDAGTGDVAPNPNRPSEALFMTVKNAGTFFAFVDSASAAVGGPTATYHLNVTVLPRPVVGVNCTTYTSTDVPKTIGPGTGLVSSTITIPGNPRIADIRVSIVLNHALMQDVDVHLRSPAGNDNGLFTDIGAAAVGGQTMMDVTFDDSAGISPAFTAFRGLQLKPENNSTAGTASTSGAYRLGWFVGENAGGTWTLDIRDDTAGANGGTLTAWSITICEEAPLTCPGGPVQTVFSTDFESGAAGFTHSGAQDEWELGLPATIATTTANPVAAFNTCNSGVNCWKTDLDNTYNASSNQELLSPNINLAGFAGPITLSWAQRDQIETANFDHAYVEVREVGNPGSAVRVWEWLDPTPISASAGTGNPQANIGGSVGWSLRRADITSFLGKNIEVRFHLDTDTSVQFGGIAIDDVTVTACSAVVPCVITCPANVSQSNDPNQCSAVVTYAPPTTTGDCGTVTCSPASGSTFPVGTTTVTCQNTGGTPSCTFTVTVNDTQAPTLTCPANITQSNDPNQCGAVVTYTNPAVVDNCPGSFTVTCSPASGSFFPAGTTTVTCQNTGGTPSCTFTVTVNDTQAPAITCPANITQSNDPNQCGAVVNYPPPVITDNCAGSFTATCTPASGSFFPVGTTTVTCTVNGLGAGAPSCTFTVTVLDTQAPTITCPANATAVTPACGGTTTTVTYPPPTASDNCPGVTTACVPPSGSVLPTGVTTVTCTATDATGNTATCSFTVTVFNACIQDDTNPNIVLLWNTTTGAYRFCCNGTTYTGVGLVINKGSAHSVTHTASDRRINGMLDCAATRGQGGLQLSGGSSLCSITDRDIRNNTCNCGGAAPPLATK